jgi:Right handed beta helix region
MNKNIVLSLSVFILYLAWSFISISHANAATYYVSKNGSDNNSCSQAQSQSTPKLTITAGLSCVSNAVGAGANQIVEAAAGTYSEQLNIAVNLSGFPTGTSWSAPFTLRAHAGDTVVLNPTAPNATLQIFGDSPLYVVIAVGGATRAGDTSTDFRFLNNKIHDGSFDCGAGGVGGYCYPIYWGGSNSIFQGNELYHFPSFGFHIFHNGGAPSNNIIRDNIVHDFADSCGSSCTGGFESRGAGILVAGTGHQIYDNVVYNGTRAVNIFGAVSGASIYNNTIYNMSITGISYDATSNLTIKNNIVYNPSSGSGDLLATGGDTGTVISTNLCNSVAQGCAIVANPQFANAAGADFHLQAGSPAIDAGAVIPGITDGYVGSAPDIGAFEYGGSPTNCNPVCSTPPAPPPAGGCQNLWNCTLSVPSGFGASFNWFSTAKELLINVLCSGSSESVSVGNGSQTQYIYNQGYYWGPSTSSGQAGSWTPYTYSCSNLLANAWCVGNASASLSLDPTTKQSVLAYICDWNGTNWNCGCHDSSCATNYWNLQQFKQ